MTKNELRAKWEAHRNELAGAINRDRVKIANLTTRVQVQGAKTPKGQNYAARLRFTRECLAQRVAQLAVIDLLLLDVSKW